MSKTYEALKKAEAEKQAREGRVESQKARGEEPLRSSESAPDSSDTPIDASGSSPASNPSAARSSEEAPRPSETVTDSHPRHTNGQHILTPPPNVEEQYQRLYARLVVRGRTLRPIRTLMLVGAHHGDGVTTTASLFARALAKSRTVLLVDANLRTPALAEVFGVRANGGLADFLARKVSLEEAITQTEVPNLFLMTSGSAPLAPPYLFEAGPFDELLADLKEKFNYIVFDGAPLAIHLDSIFLASRVDGVILVVKAESTPVEAGQEVKRKLDEVEAQLLGVIVNRIQTYVPQFVRRLLA